jgi:ComF family protein
VNLLWRAHLTVFPPACWQCGRLLPRPSADDGASAPGYPHLCADCHAALPWRPEPTAGGADDGPDRAPDPERVPGLERVWAAFRYESPLREWIWRLKYQRRDGVLRLLAGLLARAAACAPAREAALAVPVPLHPWRLWQRGFNQSLLLAHAWRRALTQHGGAGSGPLPVLAPDVLVRHRYTRPQVRMRAAERLDNMLDAFSLHPRLRGQERPLEGRHVLLVDDVATTGATLTACASVLGAAGAVRVEALVLARARRDEARGAPGAAPSKDRGGARANAF